MWTVKVLSVRTGELINMYFNRPNMWLIGYMGAMGNSLSLIATRQSGRI